MPKRRRERDKPKAGPEALYNPNKRVLLSYDDDQDTQSLDPVAVPDPRAIPGLTTPSPAGVEAATRGQEQGAGQDSDEYDPDALLRDVAYSASEDEPLAKANANPGKNATTMQKPALGSLAYQWDDEGEEGGYGSAEDEAMAYLRAVRQERQSMPLVLKAVDSADDADPYQAGDSRGYYDEDCYIARPVVGATPPLRATVSPLEAYTNALCHRFKKLRTRLHEPPDPTRASDSPEAPILEPRGGNKAYSACINAVRKSTPRPSQLIAMSEGTVFAMLEVIETHCLMKGKHINRNTSPWILALLARLDDVGTMSNDQVSMLRELGKQAVIVQLSFSNATAAAQLENLGFKEKYTDGRPDVSSTVHQTVLDVATSDVPTAEILDSSPTGDGQAIENTLATLDMILTLVGEFFGQRDLLDFRRSWEPDA